MVTVRKQIEGLQPGEAIPLVGERSGIAGKRHRVTGDIHNLRRMQGDKIADHFRSSARAWWIQHNQRFAIHRGRGLLALPFQKLLRALATGVESVELLGVHRGQFGRSLIGFNSGHRHARTSQPRTEHAHPAIKIEMRRVNADTRDIDGSSDRVDQGVRGVAMHLPEPGLIDQQLEIVHAPGHRRTMPTVEHDARAVAVGDQLHTLVACPPSAVGIERLDGNTRQREALKRHHRVAARCEMPHGAVVCDVQGLPGAPAQPRARIRGQPGGVGHIDCQTVISTVVAGRDQPSFGADCTHRGRQPLQLIVSEATDAPQCVVEHLLFEHALARQCDMPQIGAADSLLGCARDRSLRHGVRSPVGRGIEHLQRHRASETRAGLDQARPHPLARDGARDEDDAASVTGHEHALVGDAGNIKVDGLADTGQAGGGFGMHVNDSSGSPRRTVPLLLASTSPARLAVLRSAGIEPELRPSHVDEDAVLAEAQVSTTAQKVLVLAQAKAQAVLNDDVDALVLGGDSLFELDGVALGKPHTPERAVERIRSMRGRTGILHSGHWLIDHRGGSQVAEVGAVDTARVTFGDISDAEIEAYVATGEPLEVAGSFTVDGLGQAFITRVEGAPSCVIGLSVPMVRDLASQLGVSWPQLWNRGETAL